MGHCTTKEIGKNFVVFTDGNGAEQRIDCDAVVLSGGREQEPCMELLSAVPESYLAGDCGATPASIREATYSACCAAMRL